MAGNGRNYFKDCEKTCLQELILKYRLNSVATSIVSKKAAWARLAVEYNSIKTNSKRTEAQLKKCWDNLKTRRKCLLIQEKMERMRTRVGTFDPKSPTQLEILGDPLAEQTDEELCESIHSDTPSITGSRNIRTRAIQEEFCLEQQSYERSQKRDDDLHQLHIAEKEWMVKAAEEKYLKAKAERKAAEEIFLCNKAKREEAELRLAIFKNKIGIKNRLM